MKRVQALIISAVLLVSTHSAAGQPLRQEVPNKVQIVDQAGDANYLNDQGYPSWFLGTEFGDVVTPADASSEGDILKVWFTNDATTVSAHIQTESPPPASVPLLFGVGMNPVETAAGTGTTPCVRLFAYIEGKDSDHALYRDCTDEENREADFDVAELKDGTGVVTITAPRSYSYAFGERSVLSDPRASTRTNLGLKSAGGYTSNFAFVDDTKAGSDYRIRRTKRG